MPRPSLDLPTPFGEIVRRLATGYGPAWDFLRESDVTVTPVRLHRGPRSTVLQVEAESCASKRRFFIKTQPERSQIQGTVQGGSLTTKREYEILCALHRRFGEVSAFRVVKPLAYVECHDALVTEDAACLDLSAHLWRRVWHFNGRKNLGKVLSMCLRCGQWLRRFQSNTEPQGRRRFSLPVMREYNDARLQILARSAFCGVDQGWRSQMLAVFDSLAQEVLPDELRNVIVHGDFCPSNLLVSADKVIVVDFGSASEGSYLHDITHLYFHLQNLSTSPRFPSYFGPRLGAAAVSGYDPKVDVKGPLFRLFCLQHVLCKLCEYAQMSSGNWLMRLRLLSTSRHHLRRLDRQARCVLGCRYR